MKKTTITLALIVMTLGAFAQEKKQDSLVLQIILDTTTFKNVIKLIDENIDGRTLTGKMVKENILAPLMTNYKLVANKPEETPQIKKKP